MTMIMTSADHHQQQMEKTKNKKTRQPRQRAGSFSCKGAAAGVGRFVSKTCVGGWNLKSDASESFCRYVLSKRTQKEVKRFIFVRACRGTGNDGLCDTKSILRATSIASVSSCQRGILEVCALKMSGADRRRLLTSMGNHKFSFACRDKLFRKLRRATSFPTGVMISYVDVVMKQQWYERVELGQVRTVDALYRIISSNPVAFCQMVAC